MKQPGIQNYVASYAHQQCKLTLHFKHNTITYGYGIPKLISAIMWA